MAGNKGYIKLHRGITDWGWYSDINTSRVFIHLLLTANYEDFEFMGHKISAGSVVVGRKALAEATGLSEQNVRTALEHLKSTNEITIKPTNKFSIVTIENWGKYQLCTSSTNQQTDQQANQQLTNNQPTTNQQLTTIKEIKNIRNKEIKNIYSDVPELEEALKDFVEHRKKLKKPMTDRAMQLLISKLKRMSDDTETQIAIINQSIEHGWQTVYELKEPIKRKVETRYEWEQELC